MRSYTWTEHSNNFFRVGIDHDFITGDPLTAIVHGEHPDKPVYLTMKEIETIHGEMLARERVLRALSRKWRWR